VNVLGRRKLYSLSRRPDARVAVVIYFPNYYHLFRLIDLDRILMKATDENIACDEMRKYERLKRRASSANEDIDIETNYFVCYVNTSLNSLAFTLLYTRIVSADDYFARMSRIL
jgi:hypothetical protein